MKGAHVELACDCFTQQSLEAILHFGGGLMETRRDQRPSTYDVRRCHADFVRERHNDEVFRLDATVLDEVGHSAGEYAGLSWIDTTSDQRAVYVDDVRSLQHT